MTIHTTLTPKTRLTSPLNCGESLNSSVKLIIDFFEQLSVLALTLDTGRFCSGQVKHMNEAKNYTVIRSVLVKRHNLKYAWV
jgi:hypothetical protein